MINQQQQLIEAHASQKSNSAVALSALSTNINQLLDQFAQSQLGALKSSIDATIADVR